MARKEDELFEGIFASECEDGVAFAQHVSNEDNQQGFLIKAENEESAIDLSRKMEDGLGFDPTKTERIRLSGSGANSFFGFSSNNWGGSTWKPAGPEPNWRVGPPSDPHAN